MEKCHLTIPAKMQKRMITHLASVLTDLVLIGAGGAQLGLRTAGGAVSSGRAKSAITERTGARRAIVVRQAGARGIHGAA
jgi:hypothetical protein